MPTTKIVRGDLANGELWNRNTDWAHSECRVIDSRLGVVESSGQITEAVAAKTLQSYVNARKLVDLGVYSAHFYTMYGQTGDVTITGAQLNTGWTRGAPILLTDESSLNASTLRNDAAETVSDRWGLNRKGITGWLRRAAANVFANGTPAAVHKFPASAGRTDVLGFDYLVFGRLSFFKIVVFKYNAKNAAVNGYSVGKSWSPTRIALPWSSFTELVTLENGGDSSTWAFVAKPDSFMPGSHSMRIHYQPWGPGVRLRASGGWGIAIGF